MRTRGGPSGVVDPKTCNQKHVKLCEQMQRNVAQSLASASASASTSSGGGEKKRGKNKLITVVGEEEDEHPTATASASAASDDTDGAMRDCAAAASHTGAGAGHDADDDDDEGGGEEKEAEQREGKRFCRDLCERRASWINSFFSSVFVHFGVHYRALLFVFRVGGMEMARAWIMNDANSHDTFGARVSMLQCGANKHNTDTGGDIWGDVQKPKKRSLPGFDKWARDSARSLPRPRRSSPHSKRPTTILNRSVHVCSFRAIPSNDVTLSWVQKQTVCLLF